MKNYWQARGQAGTLALGGQGNGVTVRATITFFGPILLARVLGLNETRESSLQLVFHYVDTKGPKLQVL